MEEVDDLSNSDKMKSRVTGSWEHKNTVDTNVLNIYLCLF